MPRFFAPTDAFEDGKVYLRGDDARHVARSLRMAVGDEITVCDMKRREHRCRLASIRDELCECLILETCEGRTESPAEISLYMAYPKGDKLELVIQKAVELGAARIIPFESSRCIKRPAKDRLDKQIARYARIAEEAAKQCGRAAVPTVEPPLSFSAALDSANEAELALFCYEGDGTLSLKQVLRDNPNAKTVSVTVGSEGGFSIEESREAISRGLIPVNLGPRILR